ncbi:MAG TPA: anthranilate synthase component I family protein, partial [Vampirovibrionales bacterium]
RANLKGRKGIFKDLESSHLNNYEVESLIPDNIYKENIDRILELIKEGQIYQANLTRPFLIKASKEINSQALSNNLRSLNPAPYASYYSFGQSQAICSASPECFLLKKGTKVSTFPIKGTRKVSANFEENQIMKNALLSSKKERAEHLMVVDLERNDLGKFAIPGSVRVSEFAKIQSYEYVHHLVSEVSCQISSSKDIFDVIKATFPSGSVTGAPKIKAMQVINNLEKHSRGPYTGCFGFIDSKGDGVFSILIRSLFVSGKEAICNVGGGIVYDSDPDFENEETYLKAKGLLDLFEKYEG